MQPLWSPSQSDIEATNIYDFMQAANAEFGLALANYDQLHRWSVASAEDFWSFSWDYFGVLGDKGNQITQDLTVLEKVNWFPQARINFAENLLTRRDEGVALHFRVENVESRSLSWAQLYDQVSQLQQFLIRSGIQAGDRVAGCMPNCPETIVAMLATTSLGAVWTQTSPDFGANSIVERFGQVEPKLLFTVDGYVYNGKPQDIREKMSEVREQLPTVQTSVLFSMLGLVSENGVSWNSIQEQHDPCDIQFTRIDFNDPGYILYSSGTTGKPKCIVHRVGGVLMQHMKEQRLQCDVKPGDTVFWFTTCGWMMWNWLVSALASGATIALYDGSPMAPTDTVLFDYADEVGITHFGTSPKFLDSLKKAGHRPVRSHDLSSIRVLASTGSVLAPETFDYVYQDIKADVQLVSTSGGTDICGSFIGGNPMQPVYKGQLQSIQLGLDVAIFDDDGQPVVGERGELVCRNAHVSMPAGFWNDPDGERYHNAYFDRFDNIWCHGDFVEITEQKGLIVHGRSDATLNPGGVRIGTAEIYRHVEQLDEVLESVAIGQEWDNDVRVVLFVVLRDQLTLTDELSMQIKRTVRSQCTPRHVPAQILQVPEIPRTRSGKIVELAIREVVHNRPVKNQTALGNPEALEHFRDRAELSS
jgi:acetoacetyl-CoA synthetase